VSQFPRPRMEEIGGDRSDVGLPGARVELTIRGDVEALHLDPGDRVIVTIDQSQHMRADVLQAIQDQMKIAFPNNQTVILANGLRITRERDTGGSAASEISETQEKR
jgi:protein involved in polysaccharide export with SLBB domain